MGDFKSFNLGLNHSSSSLNWMKMETQLLRVNDKGGYFGWLQGPCTDTRREIVNVLNLVGFGEASHHKVA